MQKQNNNQNPQDKKPNNIFNHNPLLMFVIFAIIAIVIFRFMSLSGEVSKLSGASTTKTINYYEMKKLIENKEVDFVAIGQTNIKATANNAGGKIVYNAQRVSPDNTLIPLLDEKGVEYTGYSESNWLSDMLFGWVLPIFIFFAIWMFLANRMQKNMGNGILGIGSSKRLVNAEKPNVKFDDMAGNVEAKDEVVEIVDFLKNPERYAAVGAKIPKGVLLVGPPGTGKTLLAKAVAGEANVPFFSVSGSSFIEMFVGVGASRVRDLFENAKKNALSFIFIVEIEPIGKRRQAGGIISGNDER